MILASESFVRQRGLEGKAIEILGMEMATDLPSSFNENSCIKAVSIFHSIDLNTSSNSVTLYLLTLIVVSCSGNADWSCRQEARRNLGRQVLLKLYVNKLQLCHFYS